MAGGEVWVSWGEEVDGGVWLVAWWHTGEGRVGSRTYRAKERAGLGGGTRLAEGGLYKAGIPVFKCCLLNNP